MKNMLIADDHVVTRRGIRDLLSEEFPGVAIAEAQNGDEVLSQVGLRAWDLIVLDIHMAGPSIIDVLSFIRGHSTDVPVLVLTAAAELEHVIQTMKAGATGLIHKHRAAEELIEAVRKVMSGSTYLHSETASALARSLREEKPVVLHEKLSGRELEIFRLIAVGLAVKEIAAELDLSEKTVATYLGRIREKTGLKSHVEIARYALRSGIVK